MKKKTSRKKIEDKLDKAWALYVRKRDKFCQLCGGSSTLAAHHAFGRTHRATRWDVINGVALCWPCHKFRAHGDPAGFSVWFEAKVGEHQYSRLSEDHRIIIKHTDEDLQAMLKNIDILNDGCLDGS
jgi:ribosomal protein S27AE